MRRAWLSCAVWLLVGGAPARADDAPWRVGVSPVHQASAQALLDAGNVLILDNDYAGALEKYRQAVAIWEHPAIRFNMVRCLIQLERWLEASESLELALKYGGAPFDQNIHEQALAFQKLLANQIGSLVVDCAQDGVEVALDGKPLSNCPTRKQLRLLPGPHQIVGTKRGYLPQTASVVVLGGKEQRVGIKLEPLGAGARITHRWRWWAPWAVVGGGAALAGVGELVHLKAVADNDLYKASVSSTCTTTCDPNDPRLEQDARSRAEVENGVAIGVFAVAGAVIVTGATMVYLNRGRTVYDSETATRVVGIDIIPRDGGATVTAIGRF